MSSVKKKKSKPAAGKKENKCKEEKWGFDFADISKVVMEEDLPAGHYVLWISSAEFRYSRTGDSYLHILFTVDEAQDPLLVGRTYFRYVSMEPDRLRYFLADLRKMQAPQRAINGSPKYLIGTTTECDLVKNSKGYVCMMNIKPAETIPAKLRRTLQDREEEIERLEDEINSLKKSCISIERLRRFLRRAGSK